MLLRLTAVLAEIVPARIVTPRPPDVVTGATPDEVPTILTSGVPLIWSNPDDALTNGMLKDGALLQGLVPMVDLVRRPAEVVAGMNPAELVMIDAWSAPATTVTVRPPEVVTGATPEEVPTRLTSGVPLICNRPDDALTKGTLKDGALDHGFVPAVAVTVCTLLRVTIPLDSAVADDRLTAVLPPAPARIVTPRPPEVVTGAIPDEVPTMLTRGVPLICRRPDEALTKGMLNPGADDHGLVPAVAVTVWTLLRVTVPDDRAAAEDRLTAVVALVIVTAVLGLVTWISNPPDDVTGAIAVVLNEPTVKVCLC